MKHWLKGIGAYWCIIEMLYEEWWFIWISEYERITFELRAEENVIKEVINDFDLFEQDDINFWSNSVLDRLKARQEKSDKARESIQKRWDKKKGKNTNVLRTKYDSNTIKERKGKEIKVNKESFSDENKLLIKKKIDSLDKWTARYDFYCFLLDINDSIEEKIDTEKIDNKLKEFYKNLWEQKAILELESFREHHVSNKTVFKSTIGRLNTWLSNKIWK